MIERFKRWLLRRLGYSYDAVLATLIHEALRKEQVEAWLAHQEVSKVTVYVGDMGDFYLDVKRRRHPDAVPLKTQRARVNRYIGEPFPKSTDPRLRGKKRAAKR